jgi:ABC-2 type transport system ATP-binding protein
MWALVRGLRERGVTVILTTHYIEEAEEMADRIGIIRNGELILVEDKAVLMHKLGKKLLTLHLKVPLAAVPAGLAEWPLVLRNGGNDLEYAFEADEQSERVPALLRRMEELEIVYLDLNTRKRSLEEIFISLVSDRPQVAA